MIQLIIVSPGGEEQRVSLDRDEYVLGRDPTVSIPLRDRKVSRQHARIFRKGQSYYIEDLGSVNGVLVGGVSLRGPRKLAPGLELDVGGFKVTPVAERLTHNPTFTFTGRTPPFAGQEFLLPQGELQVGRVDGNAIVIPDTSVSRNHATVTVSGSAVVVEDLGSSNGSFINGARITKRPLSQADVVAFGNVEFEFTVSGESASERPAIGAILGHARSARMATVLASTTVLILLGALVGLLWPAAKPASVVSNNELAFERELDGLLSAAKKAVQQENWQSAQQHYRTILKEDPIHVGARDGLQTTNSNERDAGLLVRAKSELSHSPRLALQTASQVSTTAFYAESAANIIDAAREKLAKRLEEHARAACLQKQWDECRHAVVDFMGLKPQSQILSLQLEEAETGLKAEGIEFEQLAPQLGSDIGLFRRYPDVNEQYAISQYIEGDLAGATQRAVEASSAGASDLANTLALLQRELDAGSTAEANGNVRSALIHWARALRVDGRILPPDQPSVTRSSLERRMGEELYKLGEAAFQSGIHTDAFHYWSKGARLTSTNQDILKGIERLEAHGQRVLSELPSTSSTHCASIREVLATTKQSSPVHFNALSASRNARCPQ